MEAELKCLRAVGSMEERMRNACNAPNASFDSVVKAKYTTLFLFYFNLLFAFSSSSANAPHHPSLPFDSVFEGKTLHSFIVHLTHISLLGFFFLHLLSAFSHTYYSHNRIQVLM